MSQDDARRKAREIYPNILVQDGKIVCDNCGDDHRVGHHSALDPSESVWLLDDYVEQRRKRISEMLGRGDE
ncbi:hypothetical protein [Rhodococcus sp. B10]|uniref:hypothetical protein n=1 Tax=Rhodococcus sp. B10 TaxID=2695876 RepID=UPI001431CDF8|nr:hypothetical protein [Rhodococcus sp. B10]NIL77135.1 hypothetical protein [Rhodococcus sp. B10]